MPNGYVYETFGISKHFPVKLQLLLIRAETFDNPLPAKCFIYDVTNWPFLFSVIFSFNLLHRFCLPCVGVGKLFGWFWSCVSFFERPANVLDYEALGSVKSIAKSSNEEMPFNSFVSIQSIPLPGV